MGKYKQLGSGWVNGSSLHPPVGGGMLGPVIKHCAIAFLLIPGLIQVGLAQPAPPAYVLTGVHVLHPVDEQVNRDQTVVVIGRKISFVGARDQAEVPAGATSIDTRGGYLLPGLAEMHAHVPLASQGEQYLQDMLFLWVANGVTTIRGMRGEPSHLTLREQLADGTVLGPRLITAGPALTGDAVDGPEDARATAQAHVAAGYDFIKVHWRLSREEYDAIAEVARAAGVPFAGHVAEDVGLDRALAVGQASIDHLDGYFAALLPEQGAPAGVEHGFMGESLTPFVDPRRMAAVAEATRTAGVWNAPTQSMVANFMRPLADASERPGLPYMPVAMTKRWRTTVTRLQSGDDYDPDVARKFLALRRQMIKALHDAGARATTGTTSTPPRSTMSRDSPSTRNLKRWSRPASRRPRRSPPAPSTPLSFLTRRTASDESHRGWTRT